MQPKFSTIGGAILCALILTACGGSSNGTNNQPNLPPQEDLVDLNLLGGRVAVPLVFVDAKTGEPIFEKVILTASDDLENNNVYEDGNLGDAATSNITGSGVIFLKEQAVKNANPVNPVKLRLIASAEGYFSSSIDIIYRGGTPNTQKITLVSKAAPPAGVAIAVQRGARADSTGTLSTALNLTAKTTDTESKGASATFTLPAGTVLKDEKGQPLTGELKVSTGYFSPKAANIGEVFPGGLAPNQVRTSWNGTAWQTQAGYFITAGLLAVDIVDSQGRKAHLLDNAQGEMTIQAPAGLINPETNQPIKDGDSIPIWSHNEADGLWQYENQATFRKNAEGNFEVSYSVDHLSYWNLDWWYYNGRDGRNDVICNTINVNFNKSVQFPAGAQVTQYISNWGAHYTYYIDRTEPSTLMSVPNTREVMLVVTDNQTGEVIGQGKKVINSCADITINITKDFPAPRDLPTRVILTAPQGFTRNDINSLIRGLSSLNEEQRAAILKYTHPNDPNSLFKPDHSTYQKIVEVAKLNNSQLAKLQAVMSAKISIQAYFTGIDQNQNSYFGQISSLGDMTLHNVPATDTTFRGLETINLVNWWSGQPFSYTQAYAGLAGYVQNRRGQWEYFYIPLRTPHTIKKEDKTTTIIFEDIEAIKRVVAYFDSQLK